MKKKLQNNLIISSIITLIILGLILISINTLNINETKLFTGSKINQKSSEVPQNREVVNIPDKVLKDRLLNMFKNKDFRLGFKLIDENYIKPENENEIYKDEMEKIIELGPIGPSERNSNLDITGIETAINLEKIFFANNESGNSSNYIKNFSKLSGLKKIKMIEVLAINIFEFDTVLKLESLEEVRLYRGGVDDVSVLNKLKLKGKKVGMGYNNTLYYVIQPEKNKFNIPVLKNENNEVVDVIKELEKWEYNKGKLKRNIDGTYSFINKEVYILWISNVKIKSIGDVNVEEFGEIGIHIYPPKSNYKETETITKTVKDKSENILNTENEKKLKAVLKRNGKIIDVKPVTNIGHRKNAKQLIEFKFNNLRVYEDAKENEVLKEYNYEVEITGEDLSEGYKLEKNNKSDGNDGDYVVTYISPKIDATFKLVYQGIGGDDEKPKVNIRLTRNGVAFGDVVTINGEYEYIFKGIDKTDEKEKPYKYGVEVVGEVTGYDATISADGNTVILTKKIEKGKILPYAGPKTNILFGIALVVIIGYAVKVFSNQRRMNNIKKIKGIKR